MLRLHIIRRLKTKIKINLHNPQNTHKYNIDKTITINVKKTPVVNFNYDNTVGIIMDVINIII